MLVKFIAFLLALVPRHELNKDAELREEVIRYFVESANKYGDIEVVKEDGSVETIGLEPAWLIYYAKKESSLLVDVVGDRGEIGYCQAHGRARSTCEAAGYDLKTRRGGAMCMGLTMNMGVRRCGDFIRGMAWYASGSCNLAVQKMTKRHERFTKKWEGVQRGEINAATRRKKAMEKAMAEQKAAKKEEVVINMSGG